METLAPPRKKRSRLLWLSLPLFTIAAGLLTGTATGRMQLYRILFTVGSDPLRVWSSERMGDEAPGDALPVIFALLEDPEVALPAPPDTEGDALQALVEAVPSSSSVPPRSLTLLIRAAFRCGPPQDPRYDPMEPLRTPRALEAIIEASRSHRPELRGFAFSLLARIGDFASGEPRPAIRRIDQALRGCAREDPDPRLRRLAINVLFRHERCPLSFFLSALDSEGDLLTRGAILSGIHRFRMTNSDSCSRAERERVLGALVGFWIRRLQEAAEAERSRGREPGDHFVHANFSALTTYGEEAERQILAWIRAHPENEAGRFLAVLASSGNQIPLGKESTKVALALIREHPDPKLEDILSHGLIQRRFDPLRLLAVARSLLSSSAGKLKGARLIALLASWVQNEAFDPVARAAITDALLEALKDPALHEPLRPLLTGPLLRRQPGAQDLLTRMAKNPESPVRFSAQCALLAFPPSPSAASPGAFLDALLSEDPERDFLLVTLSFTGQERYPPTPRPGEGRLIKHRVLEGLGLLAVPILIRALEGREDAALDRLLSVLECFQEGRPAALQPDLKSALLRQISKSPCPLQGRARARLKSS